MNVFVYFNFSFSAGYTIPVVRSQRVRTSMSSKNFKNVFFLNFLQLYGTVIQFT